MCQGSHRSHDCQLRGSECVWIQWTGILPASPLHTVPSNLSLYITMPLANNVQSDVPVITALVSTSLSTNQTCELNRKQSQLDLTFELDFASYLGSLKRIKRIRAAAACMAASKANAFHWGIVGVEIMYVFHRFQSCHTSSYSTVPTSIPHTLTMRNISPLLNTGMTKEGCDAMGIGDTSIPSRYHRYVRGSHYLNAPSSINILNPECASSAAPVVACVSRVN